MDLGLRGKVCLVTGVSSGIGRATAVMLAAEGAQVVGTARSEAAFAAVADEVRTAGGVDPVLLVADFAEDGATERLASAVLARAGRMDVLVNNAGGSRPMTVPDDDAAWAEGFRLGFEAPRQLAERLIPPMLDRGWGRVVNVTGAIVAKSFNAATSAKAALESWSKMAAGTYEIMQDGGSSRRRAERTDVVGLTEVGIALPERTFQSAVKNGDPHLEEGLHGPSRPAHLLSLDHAP